jgi:hypothetical protein
VTAEDKTGYEEAETEQLLKQKPEPMHGHHTAAYSTAVVPYSSSSPSASEEEVNASALKKRMTNRVGQIDRHHKSQPPHSGHYTTEPKRVKYTPIQAVLGKEEQ